jgi:hypothetical protein
MSWAFTECVHNGWEKRIEGVMFFVAGESIPESIMG